MGLVFSAGWLSLQLLRAPISPAFDRYLIPFLPQAAIPLLWFYQVYIRDNVSRLSWAVLAVFALYGVAATHDAFAGARARLEAAQMLERTGISRTAIMAGLEYDGWTQLETEGYAKHWQIANPVGAYRQVSCTGPESLQPWYLWLMTALRVRYFVSPSHLAQLADGPAAPISYMTWLLPRRRDVFTGVLPEGVYVMCR